MSNIAPAMPKPGSSETPVVETPVTTKTTVVAEPPVVDTQVTSEDTPVAKPPLEQQCPAFEVRERCPSDWEIMPSDNGCITARCNSTGRFFAGELTAFNALLRGTK